MHLERYPEFDLKKKEVVNNMNFFQEGKQGEVKKVLADIMREKGHDIEDNELPQVAVFEDNVIFSFQPYQIGTYSDGISHFLINKDKLKKYIQKNKAW